MKKMIGLMLVGGALFAMPSASSLYANPLETIIAGGFYDNDHGDRDQIKDCDDPLYDGSGSENGNGLGDGTGDGVCDYL